jgi:hypothetical protein
MNKKYFLPFMVLLGDEGNTEQGNGCSGLSTIVIAPVVFLLLLSICSAITAH